jgi:hypothetical protein
MLGSIRLLLGSLAVVWGGLVEASQLEIGRIDFDLVEQEGARDPWYQIAIAVTVERGGDGPSAHPRFADDITVSLALATQVDRSDGRSYTFYAAKAEYPSLEVGQHWVRFYLPPEIVKRDRVRGEPFAFEVEVLTPEGLEASLVSRAIQSPSALQSFRSRAAESSARAGSLRSQSQTPFAWAYPRDTPVPRPASQ